MMKIRKDQPYKASQREQKTAAFALVFRPLLAAYVEIEPPAIFSWIESKLRLKIDTL